MLLSQRTHSVQRPVSHSSQPPVLRLMGSDASGTQGHLYTLCTWPHTDTCQNIIKDKILFSKQGTISFDSFLLIINTCAVHVHVCVMHVSCHVWGSQEDNFGLVWDKVSEYMSWPTPDFWSIFCLGVQGLEAPATLSDFMEFWGFEIQFSRPCTKHFTLWSRSEQVLHTHFHSPWQYCSVNLWPWEYKPNLLSNYP